MNETLDLGTNESIFGKIKFIAGNDVTAETKASAEEMGDLMNTHVVFEAPDQLILGEVDEDKINGKPKNEIVKELEEKVDGKQEITM